jgi:hypothetical protein
MKFKFIVISESSSVDKGSGNLSIFNIIESIKGPSFPILIPKMTVSSIIEFEEQDKSEHILTLEIKQKNEDSLISQVPLKGNKNKTAKVGIKVNGYIVKEPGAIEILLKCDDEKYIKTTINATQIGSTLDIIKKANGA